MPTAPEPLTTQERRVLGLAVLAAGQYGRLATIERRFAHSGTRGLDAAIEDAFDALWGSDAEAWPDPATLSPDERAALALRLRAALAAGAVIDGPAPE